MAKHKIKVIREEMLQVANNVAQEKSIDKDSVFGAMEMALEKAARVKYGFERDIRVSINRDTGDINLSSYLEVVETFSEEEQARQIIIDEAKKIQPDISVGEYIIKELPPIDLGRVAAQNAKGVIIQKVREADKSRQFGEYKDKVGEIAVGVVKRTEFGNLIVDLGKNEAIIKREELIPRETFKNGDRVRAYIYDVKEDLKGQVDQLMALFTFFINLYYVLASVMAFLIIANTATINMLEREREMATLKTLGTSDVILSKATSIENFVMGAIAGISGIVMGYPIAIWLLRTFTYEIYYVPTYFPIYLPIMMIISVILLSILATIPSWLRLRKMNLGNLVRSIER